MKQTRRPPAAAGPSGPPDAPRSIEHLVMAVASRVIATSGARSPEEGTRLCQMTALAARVKVPLNGVPQPPPSSNLPERGWHSHPRALREVRMTQVELRASFELDERQRGEYAHLGAELLEHFYPRPLWQVLALMIEEGAGQAAKRAENAVQRYAESRVPATKRRAAGHPTKGSVRQMRAGFVRLFREIVLLAERGFDHPSLELWPAVPRVGMPRMNAAPRLDQAPRREELRIWLRQGKRALRAALQLEEGEDELEAIEAMSPARAKQAGLFRLLRNLALFAVILQTGGRVGAIAALRRCDFRQDRVGPPPDRRAGAVIDLYPRKTLPEGEVRRKPLAEGAARLVELYLAYLDKVEPCSPEEARRREGGSVTRAPQAPLFVSDTQSRRPMGPDAIRDLLSGKPRDRHDRFGRRALIQARGDDRPEGSARDPEFCGPPPHAWRAAAFQLAEQAVPFWYADNPPSGGEAQLEPRVFAHALLDHKVAGEALRGIYGGLAAAEKYELLAGRAAEYIWALLDGDLGARRRPDVARIEACAEKIRVIEGEVAFLRGRAQALHREAPSEPPPKQVVGPPAGEGHADLSRHHTRQNDAILEGVDQLKLSLFELDRRLSEYEEISDAVDQLQEVRAKLHGELHALVHDRDRWELIEDDAPHGAERIELDLDGLLSRPPDPDPEPLAPPPVRDWITPTELAAILEVGRPTVHRWLKGLLPADPARRPWEAGAAPLDSSQGPRFRRLWVGGINPGFWPGAASKRRLAEVLAGWPSGQGWSREGAPGQRCQAPLIGPDGRPFPTDEPRALPSGNGNRSASGGAGDA